MLSFTLNLPKIIVRYYGLSDIRKWDTEFYYYNLRRVPFYGKKVCDDAWSIRCSFFKTKFFLPTVSWPVIGLFEFLYIFALCENWVGFMVAKRLSTYDVTPLKRGSREYDEELKIPKNSGTSYVNNPKKQNFNKKKVRFTVINHIDMYLCAFKLYQNYLFFIFLSTNVFLFFFS